MKYIPPCCIVASLLLVVSCAKPPDAELKQAQAAIEAAKDSSRLIQGGLKKAEDALKEATAEIETQKGKALASYDRARQLLADATKSAKDIQAQAEARAKELANHYIPRIEKALAEARRRVQRGDLGITTSTPGPAFEQQMFALLNREASGGKEGMKIKLDQLTKSFEETKATLAAGNALRASDKAFSVIQDLERFYPGITGNQ